MEGHQSSAEQSGCHPAHYFFKGLQGNLEVMLTIIDGLKKHFESGNVDKDFLDKELKKLHTLQPGPEHILGVLRGLGVITDLEALELMMRQYAKVVRNGHHKPVDDRRDGDRRTGTEG